MLSVFLSVIAHSICLFSMIAHAIYLFSMIAHAICLFFVIAHVICLFCPIDTFIIRNADKMSSKKHYTCPVNVLLECTIQQGVILSKKDEGCAKIDSKGTLNVILLLVLILLIKLMRMQLFFWLIFLIYLFSWNFQIFGLQ